LAFAGIIGIYGSWIGALILAAIALWLLALVFTLRIEVTAEFVALWRFFRERRVALRGARIEDTNVGDLGLEPGISVANEGSRVVLPLGYLDPGEITRLRSALGIGSNG
jgi:hypothetical protein